MEKTARALTSQALAITSQDWECLGLSDGDNQVAASSSVKVIVERIVSLLAIRSIALLSTLDDFEDFSTSTICRTILLQPDLWPSALTEQVIDEMRNYVERIIQGYNDTPYHNREHAYHVTLSANKLLDLMLNTEDQNNNDHLGMGNMIIENRNGFGRQQHHSHQQQQLPPKIPKTYGLRRDTLMHFSLIFSAVIHDVQHSGISNRQLSLEKDALSLLYNDTSTLEQQSLTIAFTEFLQPDFSNFRKVIFPSRDLYIVFRKTVVNLILSTDISSPDRMQIVKDKWKEAFGEIEQNEERVRRESAITEITLQKGANFSGRESKRRSIGSIFSDITVDLNAIGLTSEEDEASFSASSDNDDTDDKDFGASGLTGFTGSGSSDGVDTNGSRGSHYRIQTPDSMALSLDKIEESDRSGDLPPKSREQGSISVDSANEVNSHALGYSTSRPMSKRNCDRIPGTPSPKSSTVHDPAPMSHLAKNTRITSLRCSFTGVPDSHNGLASLRLGSEQKLRRRRASLADGPGLDGSQMRRMQRRFSSSSCKTTGDLLRVQNQSGKYRQRLGIMRSLDLGGETIENFSRKGSLHTASLAGSRGTRKRQPHFPFEEYDEPDELRAAVVLETMLLACDVGHNLQSWDHSLKWSQRLFWELHNANAAGRGFDPAIGWKTGQTGFLQNYVLPLAQKLAGTGVFGVETGLIFAKITQNIIDLWELHGQAVTSSMLSGRDVDLLAKFSKTQLSL